LTKKQIAGYGSAIVAGGLLFFLFITIIRPNVVQLTLNAAGCTPNGLSISTRATTLRVTNTGDDAGIAVTDADGKVLKAASLKHGKQQDLRLHLSTGYYTLLCGADQLARLTVGQPKDQPIDLGSVAASTTKKKTAGNTFSVTNLVASNASYDPLIVDPDLIDAWGLANRPAGAGGHFWVTANKTGNSLEYVGDVGETPLYMNDLRVISVPGSPAPIFGAPADAQQLGQPTGVVFNPNPSAFIVDQGSIKAPAKFIFAGQDGTISAWTEQNNANGSVTRLAWATKVADLSLDNAQFFGLAVTPDGNQLLAADFGDTPQIRSFDSSFKAIPTQGFQNPFVKAGQAPRIGDLEPWNVTTIDDKIYVSYAAIGADSDDAGYNSNKPAVGEEDHAPGAGRVVAFNADGSVAKIFDDKGSLDAPWGITKAPKGFGRFSGDLLVANFGDGSISAFKPDGTFDDWLRNPDGSVLVVPGVWALLPGNGASLGASDAVYFTAGPNGERDGVFGRINAN
jgi:uncharacterized protein (TIGR03118 family)